MLPRPKLALNCMLKMAWSLKQKFSPTKDNTLARILDVDLDYISESEIVLTVVLVNINLTNCIIFLKGHEKKNTIINQ